MPKLQVNVVVVTPQLLDLGDALKAAIVVSAAAIVSRRADDLDANADLVVTRLDEMRRKLDGIRNGVSQRKEISFAARLKGQVKEIDNDAFAQAVSSIDFWIGTYRDTLLAVLDSKHREGMDLCFQRVGSLGRSILTAIDLMGAAETSPSPFYFEQFFDQTLHELSQKSWE